MTPFTLVMAYYENPGMLREHLRVWRNLPRAVREHLQVVIVDDGSPVAPALDALTLDERDWLRGQIGSFQLWRMSQDVRWNQDACRNIGLREAKTDWVLMTDMDHLVPEDTWRALMTAKLQRQKLYKFARVNAPMLEPYKPHPNSWALTRGLFWTIGGYDEALAGYYGTDGDFLVRAKRHAKIVDLPTTIIRYPREVIPDASTTTLTRKDPADSEAIKRIVKARVDIPNWKPLHFRVPCERVL